MAIDRKLLKWWGWGWNEGSYDLKGHEDIFFAYLSQQLGIDVSKTFRPCIALDDILLPATKLPLALQQKITAVVGEEQLKTDHYERVFHAYGKSTHDLLRVRSGDIAKPPDAIVYPQSSEHVRRILALAKTENLAVVPFGGGTSVVGGVESDDPQGRPVVTMDLTLMDKRIALDKESQTATFQAGIYGPALEESLQKEGFSLGHFPQSFEFSTLGGWIAARSSGQQSNHYGNIKDMLVSLRVVTPQGELVTWSGPNSSAGPDLNELIAGSEGAFGIITEATVSVHEMAPADKVITVIFKNFAAATKAAREITQNGIRLSYLRVSDYEETQFYLKLSGDKKLQQAVLKVLSYAGYDDEIAIMLLGTEGTKEKVKRSIQEALTICKENHGLSLGTMPGKNWKRDRFVHPYMRDELLDKGVIIDTLETAVLWERVQNTHQSVKQAIQQALLEMEHQCMVFAHLSHSYQSGTSLYFVILYPSVKGQEVAQWKVLKTKASDAVVKAGGTISHHHGVGKDHQPWLIHEKGELGMRLLEGVKRQLDPQQLMNPGKLMGMSQPSDESS